MTVMILLSIYSDNSSAAIDTRFKQTIASANGRVYAIQNDGSLWYWGKGTFNDSAGDQSPLRASPTKMLDNVIGVYADWWSGFAITSDNSLWAVGDCADGKGGKHEDTDPPAKIMDNVVEVACGYSDWIALKTDGTVWHWSYYNDAFRNQKPRKIMSGVKQISASMVSFFALKNDNTLWGWGENYNGELGVKTGDVLIYAPMKIMEDVESVYASGMSAFAIKRDSSLWGWGDNDDGLILTGKAETWVFDPYPDGSQSTCTSQFTPVKLMDDVKEIDGRNHLTVVKNDSSLWVWGYNGSGQLADGTTESSYTPSKIVDDVVDVTAKGAFTVFLKSDATLWGCGTNGVGELAIGVFDTDAHTSPVKIMDNISKPNTAVYFPSTWAKKDIEKANELELIPDSINKSYGKQITRAEFCALAVRLYETAKGNEITERKTFDDDLGDVNIQKAGALSIVTGVGNNKFDTDGLLTREQAAVMISNLAKAIGKPLTDKSVTFADNASVAPWALAQVGQVQVTGIMGGVGNNTFLPKGNYTREQSIVTMLRLYDIVK